MNVKPKQLIVKVLNTTGHSVKPYKWHQINTTLFWHNSLIEEEVQFLKLILHNITFSFLVFKLTEHSMTTNIVLFGCTGVSSASELAP